MSAGSTANPDQPKKAPLAQAIREFVTAIELPIATTPRAHEDNFKYSGLILALLQFSSHLTLESKSATCTPCLPTLAGIMHCNEKTVRRQITSLEKLGLITSRRRLRKPNVYTVWKQSQIGQRLSTQETERSKPRLDNSCPNRPESRLDNPAVLIGQESTPDWTRGPVRLDKKGGLIGQQLSNIGVKPIGSTPEGYKPEGSESSPGAKDVLSNPKPSPVKDQLPENNNIPTPTGRKDTDPNRAKNALDAAMMLYRKKTPAYAALEHCICPEDARQMLDDKVLNPAFQVALEICTILGESITHDNPRPEWQAFYVRVRTDCGPTATVQQIGELVKRLVNNGVKLDPYMSAREFAKLSNAQASVAAASTMEATA